MDDAAQKALLKLVRQSGFPFQIGVRHEIGRTEAEHGWSVSAEEYHWSQQNGGRSGFVDLLVEHNSYVLTLVIECKRVRPKDPADSQGPTWIFLTPETPERHQGRLSAYAVQKPASEEAKRYQRTARWDDVHNMLQDTPEAAYCVFESQDEKSPMIEKIADTLIPSTEAVASDWMGHSGTIGGEQRLFLPTVVTNATLRTCAFDASKIDLADGNLPEGKFDVVPFVRFRKGLATPTLAGQARSFRSANRLQERTILVVNASCLASVLRQLAS